MDTCACGRSIRQPYNSTIKLKRCPSCELKAQLKKKKVDNFFSPKRSIVIKKSSEKSKAMKLADMYFSRYIRLKHSIVSQGKAYCKDIITGKYIAIKKIDNGHCIPRGVKSTRYHEDNCRPQNRASNRFKGEDCKEIFELHLQKEIGEERWQALQELKHVYQSDTIAWYLYIASIYKLKVDELCAEMKIENPFKQQKKI